MANAIHHLVFVVVVVRWRCFPWLAFRLDDDVPVCAEVGGAL